MKKYLFITFLLIICKPVLCQTDSLTCEQQLNLSIRSTAKSQIHGRMVMFTKNYIDETTDFIQWLFKNEDCYTLNNTIDMHGTKNGAWVTVFKRSRYVDKDASKVKIVFVLDSNDIIQSVVISGKWLDMVDIFLDYWGLPNRASKIIDFTTNINDKIVLAATTKGFGKITITNNMGNDVYKQYRCK